MRNKIIVIALTLIFAFGFIIGNNKIEKGKNESTKKTSEKVVSKDFKVTKNDGHAALPLECKNCHSCDLPTKRNPCLNACPRNEIITIEHKPEEGPDIVMLNGKGKQYGKVVFSHKIHAQMADISLSCDGCHHYNTAGPIEKCSKCHEEKRSRKDITRPDLKGAMHRQCYTCHRQWSHANDCSYCHLPKDKDTPQALTSKANLMSGKNHPEYEAQPKIVYETNYPQGKVVTFFHDEHVNLFGLSCQSCHKNDNCIKCHESGVTHDKPRKHNMKGKSHEQIHKNCSSCHKDNSCDKCHLSSQKERFNHTAATGFDLGPNHSRLACNRCHAKTNPMDKPSKNCASCHKDFTAGKFNHSRTGIALDDLHKDLDCNSCHANNNFSAKPVCSDCHDDKSYPTNKPGRIVKK